MILRKSSLLYVLFFFALFLRISVMFSDFSFDVLNHISWAKDVWLRGFQDYYETRSSAVYGAEFPNYPPLAIYLFAPISRSYEVLFAALLHLNMTFPLFPSFLIPFMEDLHFLAALMKIPSILSDLGLAWIIGIMAKKLFPKKKNIHILASSMILFHITFFYNSALFGQIDTIPIFFAALGLYYIQHVKKPILAGFFLTLGLLVKPTIIVFFPVLGALTYYLFGLKKSVVVLMTSVLVFWFAYLPMTVHQKTPLYPFTSYKTHVLDAQSVHAVTNAAYNVWALNPRLFFVDADEVLIGSLSYSAVGIILAMMSLSVIVYILWKKRFDNISVLLALGLSAHLSFLFLTKINERYLILVLPFLIIPALQSRRILIPFILVSVISFLNLYKSWHVPRIELLIPFLSVDSVAIVLSAINTALFVYVFSIYWRYKPQKK